MLPAVNSNFDLAKEVLSCLLGMGERNSSSYSCYRNFFFFVIFTSFSAMCFVRGMFVGPDASAWFDIHSEELLLLVSPPLFVQALPVVWFTSLTAC